MCALHLGHNPSSLLLSRQLSRLLLWRQGRRVVAARSSNMQQQQQPPSNAKPPQQRLMTTAPENQLEQAMGAIEALGNLQHPVLQQQRAEQPVTGAWCGRVVLGGWRSKTLGDNSMHGLAVYIWCPSLRKQLHPCVSQQLRFILPSPPLWFSCHYNLPLNPLPLPLPPQQTNTHLHQTNIHTPTTNQ